MILTFDVETNGLYGEAFAVGYVLTTDDGMRILEGIHNCPIERARVDLTDTNRRETENFLYGYVAPVMPEYNCIDPDDVRHAFFKEWKGIRDSKEENEGLWLMADVAFPCEATFLLDMRHRTYPIEAYPLIDLSGVLLGKGLNPIGTFNRRQDESSAHNPLCDARQSSRIYHALMKGEEIL